MIDFSLTPKQRELKEGIHNLGKYVIRPLSLEMDRTGEVPEPFMRNFMSLAKGLRSDDIEFTEDAQQEAKRERDPKRPSEGQRTAAIAAEELAWADAALVLSLPGLASAARRARHGHPRAEEALLRHLQGHADGPAALGRLRLTEPGGGQRRGRHPHQLPQGGARTGC
jgi:alkylation response protein AidB-like acyl-CoA dehydrogenase